MQRDNQDWKHGKTLLQKAVIIKLWIIVGLE